jgi:hypothetical protein
MAYEASQPLKDTVVAAADLTAHQYKFVKLDTDGKLAAIAAATDIPYGVLQNKPDTGEEGEVVIIGITKIQADEALNENDVLGTSADGQAQVIVAGTDTTVYIVGRCRLAAGAASRIGTAVVNCAAPARAA